MTVNRKQGLFLLFIAVSSFVTAQTKKQLPKKSIQLTCLLILQAMQKQRSRSVLPSAKMVTTIVH